VRDKALARIDWIKLDVDGHELDVLKAGTDVSTACVRGSSWSSRPYCHAGTGFEEIVAILANAGYEFREIPGEKVLAPDPKACAPRSPRRAAINILAVPVR
jgi:hypothetical protein